MPNIVELEQKGKEEEWRPVVGWELFYEVSSHGRVRGRQKGVILSPSKRNDYLRLTLYNRTEKRTVDVHVLVVETFIGPIPEGFEVNHKDFDRGHNSLDNLEIVTRLRNVEHANQAGRMIHPNPARGERVGTAKLSNAQVTEIRRLWKEGISSAQLAAMFPVGQNYLGKIARGTMRCHE